MGLLGWCSVNWHMVLDTLYLALADRFVNLEYGGACCLRLI